MLSNNSNYCTMYFTVVFFFRVMGNKLTACNLYYEAIKPVHTLEINTTQDRSLKCEYYSII